MGQAVPQSDVLNMVVAPPKGAVTMGPTDLINDFQQFLKQVFELSRAKFITASSSKVQALPEFPIPEFDPNSQDSNCVSSFLGQTLVITAAAGRDMKINPSDRTLAKVLYIVALLASGVELEKNQLTSLMSSCDKNFVGVLNTLFERQPHRWNFGNLPILQAIYSELKMGQINVSMLV